MLTSDMNRGQEWLNRKRLVLIVYFSRQGKKLESRERMHSKETVKKIRRNVLTKQKGHKKAVEFIKTERTWIGIY